MIKTIHKTFNNWAEVSDWWSANPIAKRVSPEIKAETIEEYNKKNHEIQFPCAMSFEMPENEIIEENE